MPNAVVECRDDYGHSTAENLNYSVMAVQAAKIPPDQILGVIAVTAIEAGGLVSQTRERFSTEPNWDLAQCGHCITIIGLEGQGPHAGVWAKAEIRDYLIKEGMASYGGAGAPVGGAAWTTKMRKYQSPYVYQMFEHAVEKRWGSLLNYLSLGPTQMLLYFTPMCSKNVRPEWPPTWENLWARYRVHGGRNQELLWSAQYLNAHGKLPLYPTDSQSIAWLAFHTGNHASAKKYYYGQSPFGPYSWRSAYASVISIAKHIGYVK